ncbi:MAG: catalase family protein [Gammaproteobacteria bacterium]
MLCLLLLSVACTDDTGDLSRENLREDEAEQAQANRENFSRLLDAYRTTYTARGAHAKTHACLRAYFDIDSDIAADWRHGVFATPGTRYRTWLRFSNGHFDLKVSQDYRADARGLALKLLQVTGEPFEVDDVDTQSQDFLLINTPVFFVRTQQDYNRLVAQPDDPLAVFFPGFNPASWRLRELFSVSKTMTSPPASLLDPDYFSITPYKLGPHNVKYGIKPCKGRAAQDEAPDEDSDADFLQQQLAQELAGQGACFHFAVQQQKPELGMRLDDTIQVWSEDDSPFIPIATINIPAQTFSQPEQVRFCENLSFAPWHALPEHRPIGPLNRLRRHAYAASSQHRHASNATAIPAALTFWCAAPGFSCE